MKGKDNAEKTKFVSPENEDCYSWVFDSPAGRLLLQGNVSGLQALLFRPDEDISTGEVPEWAVKAIQQLGEYFRGERKSFELLLSPKGTAFQKKVWQTLLDIPYGKTWSYMDMARHLGDPKCIRAAGRANGKNPISIIVPCHRVIGSDGSLTGYAGGLSNKKYLLDLEAKTSGTFQTTLDFNSHD